MEKTEVDRRTEAVRHLRKMKKITTKLSQLYPELAATFQVQETVYQRSVAAAIMIVDQQDKR
ncbi:hypothetical protein SAMN04487914_108132 [Arthrobacter sp. ok909]|uniref:hypothetical protein n=1 Tax=Arthrobacter sp. ok909 TaxID=1761746 RepID=UPI000888BFAA|nr:hypothetical protein [Arthrobacter sp. ok909]SDP34023.1 hypothetical protein SAMN04487914_108132 [Arthrobacter sp. ok909]